MGAKQVNIFLFSCWFFKFELFHLAGRKGDSDLDTTGDEDVLSKVTMAPISVHVCHNSAAF